ncbi:hypothetical protein SEA_GUSANITA_1 [Arthrobacter phage Gusanita]|nr:hypothetical protein SEA_GUSANITA_1 [Arthrobacter phage Gusanita]
MSVTVKVACPVCGQTLSYEHKQTEAWGSIGLRDFGIVELTAHDGGQVIGPHMQQHHADGSWAKVVRQRAESLNSLVRRLDELDESSRDVATLQMQGVAQDAIEAARRGRKVAVFADTLTAAQAFLQEVVDLLEEDDDAQVQKVNGRHAITLPSGGQVTVHSTGAIPRGSSFDVVYVPAKISHERMEAVAPLVATSKHPAVIGYL